MSEAHVTPELVHKLTNKIKENHPVLSECIAEIVHAVRANGEEDFHSLIAALSVSLMLLQEENDALKMQVNNLASLIADVDMKQHPND